MSTPFRSPYHNEWRRSGRHGGSGETRRGFLKKAAAITAGLALPWPASAQGRAARLLPSERLALGFIGLGGMGSAHLNAFLDRSDADVLALCDVDRKALDAAKERAGSSCRGYGDFRELLDRPDLDAVVIATPDHWHTLHSLYAVRAGKDVYCEKPLTLFFEETEVLARAVRRSGRVFQTGSQQRSSPEFHRACSLVRSGCIGAVGTALVGLPAGGEGEWAADEEPPMGLDWDLWLGPAPEVPYNRLRHPYNFRWFYDYSGGQMTDWGAHHIDIALWGLNLEGIFPERIQGEGTFPTRGLYETALSFEVFFDFPQSRRIEVRSSGRGVKFLGSEGWVHVDRGFLETEPASLKEKRLTGPVDLFRSPGHLQNWFDCIRTRERPICDVEKGAHAAAVCHLGNIAIRTGRPLAWDAGRRAFYGDEAADRWLKKPYRAPWHI